MLIKLDLLKSLIKILQLLFNWKPLYRVVSTTCCELLWISNQNFWKIIKFYPATYIQLKLLSNDLNYKKTIKQAIQKDVGNFIDRFELKLKKQTVT